ncbi:shikimate dehydrogenase [Neisseriaceae bacterium ESL0693]|nr:shikimate dehydrogenase [Neisseriaceae bacterium ESL0693]
MALFAVFGNPVEHSLSPQIHQAFARQQQIPLIYQRRHAPLDGFTRAVEDFIQAGGIGANVTVPFKTEAYALADQLTPRAKAAQAVNTLFWRQGQLWGDNTDGEGLIQDISVLQKFDLKNKNILILGAGGAARGIILPLVQQQPAGLTIANRSRHKAQQLAQLFNVQSCDLDDIKPDYDVIINATSGSLQGQSLSLADGVLAHAQMAYDLMYAREPTIFLQQAQEAGCHNVIDGLGMLVAQAAISYQWWHGFKPDILPVVTQLRHEMQS